MTTVVIFCLGIEIKLRFYPPPGLSPFKQEFPGGRRIGEPLEPCSAEESVRRDLWRQRLTGDLATPAFCLTFNSFENDVSCERGYGPQ